MKCEDCKFWDKHNFREENDLGLCKINPPQPKAGKPFNDGFWPSIKASEWCGEFQQKEKQ